jgi:hypothetical protein
MRYSVKIVTNIRMNENFGKTDSTGQSFPQSLVTFPRDKNFKAIKASKNLKFSELKVEIAKLQPTSNYNVEMAVEVLNMKDLTDSTEIAESQVTATFTIVAPDLSKVTSVEDKDQDAMIKAFYDNEFDIIPVKLNESQSALEKSIAAKDAKKEADKAAAIAAMTPAPAPTPKAPKASASAPATPPAEPETPGATV